MTANGTIITRVFTSQARLPLAGAMVAFTQDAPDGRRTLLALRMTDTSGMTAPVRISTPPVIDGTSPGGPTPFAVCDIWAEAPGYELSSIRDVQIFPGVETVQDIELIPLPQTRAQLQDTEVSFVTPQGL